MLRAIGTTCGTGSGYHLLDHDGVLNRPALQRLQDFSGIPAEHLLIALPGLRDRRGDPLPADVPASRWWVAPSVPPCPRCAAHRGAVGALVASTPLICERHSRLLRGNQCDLAATPEIIRAWNSSDESPSDQATPN